MGILRVAGKNFRMDKFLLKTVRPFHTKDVILNETDLDPTDDAALQEYLVEQVREANITSSTAFRAFSCGDRTIVFHIVSLETIKIPCDDFMVSLELYNL